MSDFLKNLNEALANKVYIENPLLDEHIHNQKKSKQFFIKDDFGIEQIQNLVKLISNFSLKIRFVTLILPKGLIKSSLHREKNIVGRYLEHYAFTTDIIISRWDFLVEKLD